MLEPLLASFLAIGLAEVGDKTQIAILTLSCRHKEKAQILIGVFLAFLVVDGLAVLFGEAIVSLVPQIYITAISGAIFLAFGLYFFFAKGDGDEDVGRVLERGVTFMAFSTILFAEFGDKTQLATIVLAARFGNPLLVLLGVIGALMTLSLAAVYGGKELACRVPEATLHKAAAVLFILLGLATWISLAL